FLSFLYLVYIIGWALWNPKISPPLPESEQKVPVPEWIPQFQKAYRRNMLAALTLALVNPRPARSITIDGKPFGYWMVWKNFIAALSPLLLTAATLYGIWWYVVIHPLADVEQPAAKSAAVAEGKQAAVPAAPAAPATAA